MNYQAEKNAEGFRKYLEDNRTKLDRSKQCLQEPWFGASIYCQRAMRVSKVLRPHRSVAKDLMKIFDDDRLMLAMSFQTKYLRNVSVQLSLACLPC